MNYTSIEQSKKLLELGLSPETADCFYTEFGDILVSKPCEDGMEPVVPYIPCWSVGALMEVMPIIKDGDKDANPFLAKSAGNEYYIVFATLTKEVLSSEIYTNPIDACYEMVVWLLNHCYIKKEN